MDNSQQAEHPAPKKNKLRRFLIIGALVLVASSVIYYFICGLTYSEGTRSGILTKVSKKGYVFKTYEGELIIGGLNEGDGAIMPATIFKFSILDQKVYHQLEADQGRKVIVYYKEVIKNFFWQGETNYFVYQVSFLK